MFRFALLLMAFMLVVSMSVVATAAERPNIVLIYTDDVGYGDVSCNGSAAFETPNIDRIAREGIRFTDAHCTASTCTPSRFSLLTGLYPFRKKGTGVLPGDAGLIIVPGSTTLPSLLQANGYATGVVGKWHLGLGNKRGAMDWNSEVKPGPGEIGFDYHFLVPATGDRVPCVYLEQKHVVGLEASDPIEVSYGKRIDNRPSGRERPDLLKQKFSQGHNQTIINGISRIGWMTGGKKAEWVDEDMADVLVEKSNAFIEKNTDKPFFLFFSSHDVHVPRVPHSRFVGKSKRGPRGDAMIQLDWCVGELLDTLDRLGLAENTLVIFTSDNGPVLDDGYHDQANEKLGSHDPNGPYRAGKYSEFEGGSRIPMVARWPGHIKKGEVSKALFSQVDMAASLAKLVGQEMPAEACEDSRDELDTLLGSDQVGRPHAVYLGLRPVLRVGNWKFITPGRIRDNLGPWKKAQVVPPGALYDLQNDVTESKNLASEQPEKLAKMAQLLQQIRKQGDAGR